MSVSSSGDWSVACHANPTEKVLVLTHELATDGETIPQAARQFWPVRPLIMYGRSAALDPPCAKEDAVWWFWKEMSGKGHVSCEVPICVGL